MAEIYRYSQVGVPFPPGPLVRLAIADPSRVYLSLASVNGSQCDVTLGDQPDGTQISLFRLSSLGEPFEIFQSRHRLLVTQEWFAVPTIGTPIVSVIEVVETGVPDYTDFPVSDLSRQGRQANQFAMPNRDKIATLKGLANRLRLSAIRG